jgi:hypothetical protein
LRRRCRRPWSRIAALQASVTRMEFMHAEGRVDDGSWKDALSVLCTHMCAGVARLSTAMPSTPPTSAAFSRASAISCSSCCFNCARRPPHASLRAAHSRHNSHPTSSECLAVTQPASRNALCCA